MGSFVGRERELELLLGAAGQAPTAGLVVALVSGEPGIGKSALLAAAQHRLAGQGWSVLAARADRLERRIPYAAVAAALRPPGAEAGPAGPAGHVAGSAVPDLRRDALAALELSAAGPVPAPTSFARACSAVTRLLTGLAERGPVVLALDDLHELDDDSLALLQVVLHRAGAAPVVLLGAVRSHLAAPVPALDDLLARLEETAEFGRVELAALPPGELAAVIAPVLGAPADRGLLDEVYRRAAGNPFFATEIARSLREQRLVRVDRDLAHLAVAPEAVRLSRRETVLRRVAPLSPQTRAVARAVAVFRRIRLDQIGLLARVAGLPEPVVVAAFDELLAVNLVVAEPGSGYRFSHDLVADALYDDVGPAERRHLHRQIAQRLLADRARGLPVDVLELAGHTAQAAEPGDIVAVQVLTEAADRTRTSAPETAASLCARALDLLPADSGRRAGLLALQCRALARASRPAAAVEPGRAALALLPPGPDRSRIVTAVLSSLFSAGRIAEAVALADAEVAAGPAPAALHAQRALLLALADRNAEALAEAMLTESLPMASAAEEVVAFGQLAMLTSMLARHDQAVEYATRALRSAGDSPVLALQALAVGAVAGVTAGLVADATERLGLAEKHLEELGGYAFRAEVRLARIGLDWLGGRWEAALEGLPGAAAELEAHQHAGLAGAAAAIELEIRTWRGELDLAARLVRRPPPPTRNMANLRALALAGYQLARGEVDQARQTLDAAASDPVYASYSCLLLGRRIELELGQGRPAAAARVLETLAAIAAERVSPWSVTTVQRAIGLVRADPDALSRAVAAADGGGLVFEKARAQLARAQLATARPDPAVTAELVEAYLTFQRLGVHGLRREAGRRLRELGAKVPRARSRPPGRLTDAEDRIARLVQQGMRNRDIAAALHYSPRSIEVYLSRIYAKLGISSRLELARALDAQQGPVVDHS